MSNASPFRILIVGYGEIARLAHLPALKSRSDDSVVVVGLVDTNFRKDEVVVCTKNVSPSSPDGGPSSPATTPLKFASVSDAFEYFAGDIHAVSICTPKTVTLSVAWDVLKIATTSNNKESKLLGILLEKPPGDDVEELKRVVQYGRSNGISMFTAMHTTACPARKIIDSWLFLSDDAAATGAGSNKSVSVPSITNGKSICRRRLDSIHIIWKENVRKWHPGQTWISKESGGGVTDMLFNPLSLIVSLFGLSPKCNVDKDHPGEIIHQNKTISLVSADLVRPCNWEAPISGHAELLMTIPLNDSVNGTVSVEVPIVADFAFDYEPAPSGQNNEEEEEIWNIEFVGSVTETGVSDNECCLTMKDGGAQAYIGSQRVTTKPTAEYPLLPEYEALYDQFLDLLRMNHQSKSNELAPSIVDCTTIAMLKEIASVGKYSVGASFDF